MRELQRVALHGLALQGLALATIYCLCLSCESGVLRGGDARRALSDGGPEVSDAPSRPPPTCPGNCNGHGNCSAGACACNTGFTGSACDGCAAGYSGYPNCVNPVNPPACPGNCNGHGNCSGGACACNTGFTGSACDACAAGYTGYPSCAVNPPACPGNCNGHGNCSGGACACNTGFSGSACDTCAAGYTGYPSCAANPLACSGTCYYVAATGNDGNPGTLAQPWRHIQKAFDAATPGSIVYIRGGTYLERVTLNVSGDAKNGFTTFQSYPGEVAVLDGTGTEAQSSTLLNINDRSYVRVVGLRVTNNVMDRGFGIVVSGASHHVEVSHNVVTNITTPGTVWACPVRVSGTNGVTPMHDVVIANNEIDACKTYHSEALTVEGNVDGFEVSGNLVHHVDSIGIDFIGAYGASPDPSTDCPRNGVCRGNTVEDFGGNQLGIGIYVDAASNILIERNLVRRSPTDMGLEVASEHTSRNADSITLRDNVVYDVGIALAFGAWNSSYGLATNLRVSNNTFFRGNLGVQVNPSSGVVLTNNLVAGMAAGVYNPTNVAISSTFNLFPPIGGAGFASESVPDLHPVSTSPAVNAGDPAFQAGSGETDFDGKPRLAGGRVDVGAYEQ